MPTFLDTCNWILLGGIAALLLRIWPRKKHPRLPPGPPQLPFIGNVFDFPRKDLGSEFQRISQKYGAKHQRTAVAIVLTDFAGDIVYLNALGQSMLLLGSRKAARELLDKKSSNYSDRPRSVMAKLYVLHFELSPI